MVAWLLHRATGLALTVYLVMHLSVISTATASGESFDEMMSSLREPFFLLFEVLLIAIVSFHAANGVRTTLFDLGIGVTRHKEILWVVFVIAAVVTAAAGYGAYLLIEEQGGFHW